MVAEYSKKALKAKLIPELELRSKRYNKLKCGLYDRYMRYKHYKISQKNFLLRFLIALDASLPRAFRERAFVQIRVNKAFNQWFRLAQDLSALNQCKDDTVQLESVRDAYLIKLLND